MAKQISWTAMKERQSRLNLPYDWAEESEYYYVTIITLSDTFYTLLDKTDVNVDTTDFETNIKPVPQTIAESANTIRVNTSPLLTAGVSSCPIIAGDKWRSELSTTQQDIANGSFTDVITKTGPGIFQAVTLDFDTDRMDVRITIDGTEILTLDLDDIEELQAGGSSSKSGSIGNITWVKTGSRFTFSPPCGLYFDTSLVIAARAEQNNKDLDRYILHWVDL